MTQQARNNKIIEQHFPSGYDSLTENFSVDSKTQVNVPTDLTKRISNRLPNTDFSSVDDYVSYVLKEVLDEVESDSPKKKEPENVFSKEDQENVEQRLKDLGYM